MNLTATEIPLADTDWGHMAEWGAGGWVAMIAFWGLVIVAMVWIARELGAPRREGSISATELLERRLAAGEISVDEYQRRKAALQGAPDQTPQTENQD